MIHLFGCVRHAVNNALDITTHRRERRFQVMRDIADELAVLSLVVQTLLGVFLEPLTHLLKVLAQLTDLIICLRLDRKIKIVLHNVFRSDL